MNLTTNQSASLAVHGKVKRGNRNMEQKAPLTCGEDAPTERSGFFTLTRDSKQTIIERIEYDVNFAQALLDEAANLFLKGEAQTARLLLRELVNVTVGFETLAILTQKPSKSLHRMLSAKGNPSMDNLATIFAAIQSRLALSLEIRSSRRMR